MRSRKPATPHRRTLSCVGVAIVLAVLPTAGRATTSVSPTTSYNGAYTVSWTDASGGTTHAYLNESFNGGAWSKTTVTGTYTRAYSGKPVGTYSYKVQIYLYDAELKKEVFEYETNVASVLVTVLSAPGAPGPISGPSSSTAGAYTLAWTAASGTVTRYELQENAVLVQSSMALSASFSGKSSGTCTYRVRACNAAGCGPFTAEFQVSVVSTLTTTVPNDAFVQPTVPAQQWVGTLPGTPSSDGGAAGYHIPIEVPPGRAGMQPSIGLSYSSRGGNGIAGVGWSLSGTSSIYRCPRTIAQEGANRPVQVDSQDRLCMNGQRLVVTSGSYGVSGSQYHTEVDEFSRATLTGAISSQSSYFDVEHKSGLVSRYAMPAGNFTTTLATWFLVSEFDRQNNCVSYEYQLFNSRANLDQEWVLSRIAYTGNWSGSQCTYGSEARTVEFQYTSDRLDRRTTYVAGKASMMTARLAAIVTKVGGQAVRRYELTYKTSAATGRSLLASAMLCSGSTCNANVEALPPTRFSYQEDQANFAVPGHLSGPGGPMGPEWRALIVGDYDGDGTRDTVLSQHVGEDLQHGLQGQYWQRMLQLSSGMAAPSMDNFYTGNGQTVQWWAGPGTGTDLDIDNDGRSDLIGWDSSTQRVVVASLKSGSWGVPTPTNIGVGQSSPASGSAARGVDYDGDGRVDINFYDFSTQQEQIARRLCNDRLDCFATGYAAPPATFGSPPLYVAQMARDLNGDGLVDTFYDTAVGWTDRVPKVKFQTAPGSYVEWDLNLLGGPRYSFNNADNNQRRWLDVNGDGLPDIYDPGSGQIFINRGGPPSGSMFARVPLVMTALASTRGKLAFVMDVDADGQDELMAPTVRTRDYCGGDPLRSQPSGDPYWWCGAEFDAGPADDSYDRSVFAWDAYKFRERSDGSYEMVRVPTNLQAPVRSDARPEDWYGDGLPDVYYMLINAYGTRSDGTVILLGYYQGLTDAPQQHGPYLSWNQARAPDLLTSVTNGVGALAAWAHQPLSKAQVPQGCEPANGNFYVAHLDPPPSPGYVFFTSSMWAVSAMAVSNGIGAGTNATCYRYEDAMLNVRGRGFQGFKKITVEERLPPAAGEVAGATGSCGTGGLCSSNNLITTTEFNQEFPLTNRVKKVTVARVLDWPQGGRLPLSETAYSWYATASVPGAWLVYPSVTIAKRYDLGQASGNALSTTTSVSEIDVTSGEADRTCTVVDDTTAPQGGKVTLAWEDRRPLYNDQSNWWLGRVDRRETVRDFLTASFTPGPLPATCPTPPRSSDAKIQLVNYQWYAYNASQGSQRKLQSEQLSLRGVTERTTNYSYDQFGNLWTQQVTARDVVGTLPTTLTYTASPDQGYFLATETNPVGHVATLTTDPATGQPRARQAVQGGPWTRTDYDSLGRVLTVTTNGSPPASHRVAACGTGCGDAVITRKAIQAGTPTQTEYVDVLGRVIATQSEGLSTNPQILTQVRYNERGAKVAEAPPRFGVYAPWNDASPPPFLTRYSGLDALGRVGRKTVNRDPLLFPTGQGEPTAVTDYAHTGFTTTISVDRAGTGTGALLMSRTYDGRGKLVWTTQRLTAPTLRDVANQYLYDPAGNVTSIGTGSLSTSGTWLNSPPVSPAPTTITATYDDLGRKKQVVDPDRGTWSYTWDGLGRLSCQTDARGMLTTHEYDSIGRPTLRTTRALNGVTTTDAIWTYDQNGQKGVLSRVDGAVSGTTTDFIRTYSYDDFLRPYRVTTTVGALDAIQSTGTRTFTVEHGYDQSYGRQKAIRYPSLTGSGEVVAFDYAPATSTMGGGQLIGETELLADLATRGKQYRRATALSPRGQVTHQVLGNCAIEDANYDASAGMATFLTALGPSAAGSPCPAATQPVRQVDYAHDHFLNLERQVKNVAGTQATEVFTYDDLQRILTASRSWTGGVTGSEADAYTYDDLGNVASKSDKAALYLYGDSSRSVRNAGPHAVKELRNAQNGTLTTYTYDLNGNMTAGDGRTVDVDLMDRPTRVCSGTQCTANPQLGTFTDFAYAPDGARYRQKIWASPGPVDSKYGAKTVYYVDKDYELVVWADQQTEERTYVGGSVVLYRAGGGARQDRYQHLDRLGSVDAVTDGNAQKVMLDLHGYDPFGKPRGEPWTSSQERLHPAGDRGATTDRGFTGHEHLDLHYLTHMNGRMYDYRLGRFLSVDPIISNPLSSQSVNPYSYIGNNPLSGTDPTGYESVSTGCGSFAKCDVTFYHPSPSTIALYTPSNYSNGSVGHTTQVQNTNTTDAQGPQKIAQQHKGDELAKNEKEKPIRLAQVRGGGRRRSPAEPRVAGLPPENIEEIVLANRMQRAVERIESRGQRFDTVRDPTKPLAPAEVERAERMANLVDPPPTVKVPNRWGSRGSPAHREVIEQRIEELRKAGHELKGGGPLPEEVVPTPGGAKSMRRPDITTQTPDGSTHRENVGRTTKAGEPVARERRALDDIERATGKRPDYTPYDR